MAHTIRLLLIEGKATERLVFQRAADAGGFPYDFKIASTTVEARRLIREQEFDVIVAAIRLDARPVSGIFEPGMETPVIFLVPYGEEEQVPGVEQHKGFDYLVKDPAGHYLKLLHLRIEAALAMRKTELALCDAMERANFAEHTKGTFVTNASHELRTPLNGILGMAELLSRTELSPVQREYLDSIRSCGDSLLLMLNDVLDLAKVESGQLRLDQNAFDLHDAVQTSMELPALAAEKKGVAVVLTIAPDAPMFVRGDANRLRQILTNLIGNAIKFTAKGSVTIRVSRIKGHADLLRFEVKDTGIGIPPEVQATIFDPFVQAETSTSQRFGGTGLGLSICRQLVTLMNGEIGLESTPGTGTLFWFHLSLPEVAPLPAAQTEPLQIRDQPVHHRHILLAEDNVLNQRVTLEMLSILGHTADVANDGDEAIKAATARHYDLMLLDCEMPKVNGFTASRSIRELHTQRPELAHVPIVALTAHTAEDKLAQCIAHGMNGYLSKPFTISELKATLEKFHVPELVSKEPVRTSPSRASYTSEFPLPALDPEKFNDLKSLDIAGESDIMDTLLKIFFQEAPPLFSELLAAVDSGKWPEVIIHAHKLSGSCGNFGGMEVLRLCRKVEQCAKNGDDVGARNLKPLLEIAFNALCCALKQELHSSANIP